MPPHLVEHPEQASSASTTCGSRWRTASGSRRTCTRRSRAPLDGSEPLPVVMEYIPYRKDDVGVPGRLALVRLPAAPRLPRAARRLPRHGCVRGHHGRRVHAARAARRARRDRVVRRAALVRRPRQHDRHLLWRLHLAPGREPRTAAPDQHRADRLHRRSLHATTATTAAATPACCSTPASTARSWSRSTRFRRRRRRSLANWAEIWEEHLAGDEPYVLEWLRHQTDGPYWRNGSVGDVADRIRCPVFMIGGWRDGYPNPPLRLFESLTSRAGC